MSRDDCTPERTLGTLRFEDGFVCQTLEDPVREGPKIYGDTAIPLGTYAVTITRSRKFNKMMPLLHNVPGFGGVRLHCGNNTDDTSGCILVGLGRDAYADADGLQIWDSRDTNCSRLVMRRGIHRVSRLTIPASCSDIGPDNKEPV